MKKTKIESCCLTCGHFENRTVICPRVETTEAPIETTKFYCSEYVLVDLRQELPNITKR